MKKLTHREILKSKPSIADTKKKKRNPIYALLDNVRSMYNVGAIFRTSDGILLKKLFLTGITATPPRKEISKTALGAEEIVPWEYADDAVKLIGKLKKSGVQIVATELAKGAVDYSKMQYQFPVCFIFGHEVNGISDNVIKMVDHCVYVPMLGRANSLNVATCYGIIVYDALKKLR